MRLRVIREPSVNSATLGSLYIDGVWRCWTLEDAIREVPGQPVSAWKVPAQTAIPAGRYRVEITMSARFRRLLPLLIDVPGFAGVRIHPGNTIADTEGCLLVGRERVGNVRVLHSKVAFDGLFAALQAASDDIWIAIENPAEQKAA